MRGVVIHKTGEKKMYIALKSQMKPLAGLQMAVCSGYHSVFTHIQ